MGQLGRLFIISVLLSENVRRPLTNKKKGKIYAIYKNGFYSSCLNANKAIGAFRYSFANLIVEMLRCANASNVYRV